MAEPGGVALWRVFPWDEAAPAGDRFSAGYVPTPLGHGRFDLPPRVSPVLYLAESPDHAIAETLQHWRNKTISADHLFRAGHPLALVELEARALMPVADLCDPDALAEAGIAPDRSASRQRGVTQKIARRVWDAGFAGLRWWSSFWGDWHLHALFTARLAAPLRSERPTRLTLGHEAVREASRLLGIRLEGA